MFDIFSSKKRKKIEKPGKLIGLFLFFVLCVFALRGGINYGWAGDNDNVRGWAWSSTIGWISFNCVNNSTCGTSDYGVKIGSSTMNFSGYAWSSGVGWISFQDTGVPGNDYSFNVNCPSFCGSGNNCTACLDPDTGRIWGWAHIVSMGANGWIKFRDAGGAWPGVYLDTSNPSSTWRGWAWNGNDDGTGIGWVNFNCLEEDWCATSTYATWVKGMGFPVVDNMTAPNWNFDDACVATKGFTLRWDTQDPDTGASQSAYRVIVNTSNSTSSPLFDTGRRFSISEQFSTTSPLIAYGTPYYWWVKVWDNFGLASPWQQFNTVTASSTLTDNIASNTEISVNPLLTFTTYGMEFPDVSFTWDPYKPRVDEDVLFTDHSNVYFMGAPSVAVPCTKSSCSWLWTGDGIKTNSAPTASSTTMTMEYGNHFINDRVIGPGGYACTTTNPIFIDLLPRWREVKPE
jgi:hypothetical protein